jgi:oxaloacetate decarboxylase alpha subunit
MRAEAMLPAMADVDAAGYEGVEFVVATAHFPRSVRDLGDNPWDWLDLGPAKMKRTPLRLHGGIHTRLAAVPMSVRRLFLDKLAERGIQVTRTSDPWNDFGKLAETVTVMREHGLETVANIIYSVSPRHTAEYFARKTREAVAIDPYRVCFKDVGGLLTPEAARELIPVVLANAGDVPVEFHAHCNNSLAPYNVLVAADLGIRIIHTAIPPLSEESSQPSVFNVVGNLRARGHDVALDLEPLRRVSGHLHKVAESDDLPVGRPAVYDESLYAHQVPGGMISNMRFQLAQLHKEELLDEALVEVARVREDFGYPIMVTPLAQFVGTQAVVNVVSGGRYATVTDETIQYALGRWGAEAIEVMDPEVRALVLDRSRAEAIAAEPSASVEADDVSLAEARQRFGGVGISDEELITRAFMGASSTSNAIPPRGTPADTYAEYDARHGSVRELLRLLEQTPDVRRFSWREGGSSLSVTRG